MATELILVMIMYWRLCISAPCIPANTCFANEGGTDLSMFDASWLYRCDSSGNVHKDVYMGSTTCEGDPDGGASTTITLNGATGSNAGTLDDKGDEVVGSNSGSYSTDYLQGVNCPLRNSASDSCTDYFIVKHRGDRSNEQMFEGNYVGRPYLDIGDNCTAYVNNPSSFTLYDSIFIPYGCVNQFVGSKLFACSDSGWSWTHYNNSDCQGDILTAQTESFVVNKCGYFTEWTHCRDPTMTTGCVDDGILDFWWYWYDLVCCPNTATPCVPGSEPTTTQTNAPTKTPTTTQTQPTTSTTAATSSTSVTQSTTSTTSTSAGSQPTTAAPTSPGTARPTTAAPTDASGTAQPTGPTTAAPTSPGTARPSVPTYGAPSPTTTTKKGSNEAETKSILFSILCVFMILMRL